MKTEKKKRKSVKGLSFDEADVWKNLNNEYPHDAEEDSNNQLAVVTRNNTASQDSGESIKVYMHLLSKLPLLTRDQEILHANGINSAKLALLSVFCKQLKFTEFMHTLTDCGGTRLRRIFAPMLEMDSPKEKVLDLKKQLFDSVLDQTKYLKFLEKLSFTVQELENLTNYLKTVSTAEESVATQKAINQLLFHRKKLLEGNLRLVFHRAKKHANKGLSLEDLIQEGNLGLLRAVEKYDVSKGFKFGTYATWWIDQALGRACSEKGRVIRIPMHMMENINRVARTTKQLLLELGHDPTDSEITALANITQDKLYQTRELIAPPQSIEDPVGDSGIHVSEFLVQTNAQTAHDIVVEQHAKATIHAALKQLTPREEIIIRCRFGIGMSHDLLLRELGERFDISKERVRQLECKALSKLKRYCKFHNTYPIPKGA